MNLRFFFYFYTLMAAYALILWGIQPGPKAIPNAGVFAAGSALAIGVLAHFMDSVGRKP